MKSRINSLIKRDWNTFFILCLENSYAFLFSFGIYICKKNYRKNEYIRLEFQFCVNEIIIKTFDFNVDIINIYKI